MATQRWLRKLDSNAPPLAYSQALMARGDMVECTKTGRRIKTQDEEDAETLPAVRKRQSVDLTLAEDRWMLRRSDGLVTRYSHGRVTSDTNFVECDADGVVKQMQVHRARMNHPVQDVPVADDAEGDDDLGTSEIDTHVDSLSGRAAQEQMEQEFPAWKPAKARLRAQEWRDTLRDHLVERAKEQAED